MRSGRHSAAAAAAVAIAPTWREAAQSASEQDGWWMKRWSDLPQLNSAIIYSASDTWRYGATLLRNRKRFTGIFYHHCSLIGTSAFCAPVHKAYMLLQTIASHRVFMTHPTGRPQAPVQKQLAVALRRLACEYSSAGSVISTSQMFAIGEGTACLYTRRVCTALVETCWRNEVCWPGPQARQVIQNRLWTFNPDAASIMPCAVGFVDGTLIPFCHSPGFENKDENADFFNHRK